MFVFWFYLALALGKSVGELQGGPGILSRRERRYWGAWMKLHGPPAQAVRSDWQATSICRSMVGGKLAEHMIDLRYVVGEPESEEQRNARMLDTLTALNGGRSLKDNVLFSFEVKQHGKRG